MVLISTKIYTSELILCFTICVLSATRHNIHINEIHEYLDHFDEKYQRLQKDLFIYKFEKHNVVNEFDYRDLYLLRCKISDEINSLKLEIRKILEKHIS